MENFQSGFPERSSQSKSRYGSPKRRLQPIFILDEPLGVAILWLAACLKQAGPVSSTYVYTGNYYVNCTVYKAGLTLSSRRRVPYDYRTPLEFRRADDSNEVR